MLQEIITKIEFAMKEKDEVQIKDLLNQIFNLDEKIVLFEQKMNNITAVLNRGIVANNLETCAKMQTFINDCLATRKKVVNALCVAAKDGDVDMLAKILADNPHITASAVLENGYTALHYACSAEKLESAKFLIQKGADLYAEAGAKKDTPYAIMLGKNQHHAFALKQDFTPRFWKQLFVFINNKNWTVAKLLLQVATRNMIDPSYLNSLTYNEEEVPSGPAGILWITAYNQQWDLYELLYNLMLACDAITGALINTPATRGTNNGLSLLYILSIKKKWGMFKILLDRLFAENVPIDVINAIAQKESTFNGKSILWVLVCEKQWGLAKVFLEKLIENNVSVKCIDVIAQADDSNYGMSVLYILAAFGEWNMFQQIFMRYLVEAETSSDIKFSAMNNVEREQNKGKTILWWLAGNQHWGLAKILLKRLIGENIAANELNATAQNTEHKGKSVLYFAIHYREFDVMRMLIQAGCNLTEVQLKNILIFMELMKFPEHIHQEIICGNVDDQDFSKIMCPITRELILDPVRLEDGHTYDAFSIEKWFNIGYLDPVTGRVQWRNTSPLTNKVIDTSIFYVDSNKVEEIIRYIRKKGNALLNPGREEQPAIETLPINEAPAILAKPAPCITPCFNLRSAAVTALAVAGAALVAAQGFNPESRGFKLS